MTDIVERLKYSLSAGYSELRKEAAEEILRLRAENAGLVDDMNLLRDNNTALRAKIAEMEQQVPVGTLHDDGYFVWSTPCPYESNFAGWRTKLYALPGAQAQSAPSVPDGWKLVPIEPTFEMLDKGSDQSDGYVSVANAVWDAMIAAAPEVKS